MKKASSLLVGFTMATSRLRSATRLSWMRIALGSLILVGLVTVSLLYVTRLARAATITTAGSGNWNSTTPNAPWPGGIVPTATDDVIIDRGHTVTITSDQTCASLQVSKAGGGGNATLLFDATAARTLTVSGNVTILNSSGVFQSAASGTVTTHVLSVGGNLTNNGTLDFSTNGNTAGAGITFTGAASNTFSGTGATTDIRTITINKGVSSANVLEVTTSNFTVQGSTTDSAAAAYLTLTNGTFKISGSFAGTHRVFTTNSYTIGATTGFWLNNANYTVAAQGASPTLSGLLRITSGAYNVGTIAGNTLSYNTGSSFTMEGGSYTGTGRFQGVTAASSTVTFNMSGGTLTVQTIANNINNRASFDIQASGSSFTMSGGTIVIQNENTAGGSNAVDYRNRAGTVAVTGGTVQFGNASTSGSPGFEVAQSGDGTNLFPSLTINATGTPSVNLNTAVTVRGDISIATGTTLDDSGNFAIAVSGNSVSAPGNWTNNGSFTQGSSTVTFNGTRNQSIGGTASTTFSTLAISNTGAGGSNTVSLAVNTTVGTALNVTSGIFDQGATFNLTSGAVTISSGATMQNLGSGDLTLSGNVSNSGTINYNANGGSCGDADDILIRSSALATPRTWSGTGTFSMSDVDVKDQTAGVPPTTIFVTSGTNSGGNTGWVFLGSCTSGSYVWTGTVSTDWQVAANWSPTRTVPAAADVLVFDGTGTPSPTVTNVPTQTIAALRLVNSVNGVTLSASLAAQTLTVSGGTGSDLSVPSGSLLTLSGGNAITISLTGAGAQGSVGGQVIVQGGAHRLIGSNAGEITFTSGALFTTGPSFSGTAFGSGTAGSVVFATGSSYVHNSGASPFGTGSSVVTFQSGSYARYLTATGFDGDGRTYANLDIGDGSAAVNPSQTGAGNFQFDNLVINNTGSANSSLTYTGTGSSIITIRGNISTVGAGSGGTLADVTFTAAGGIVIDKAGGGGVAFANTLNSRTMRFESNTTIVSGTTLTLSRKLLLGIIQPNNSLFMTVNGGLTGSSTGYLIGNEKRSFTGAAAFTYHVGTVNAYSPMDANVTAGTGDLTVAAVQGAQPVLASATSLKRYWRVTEGGSITSDMTFHYNDPLDIMGTEADYRIIAVDGSNATSFPNDCPSGNACVETTGNTATIKSISDFSDWTLGAPAAPTAVKLRSFTATQNNNNEVTLHWQTGHEVRNLGYYVYREQNGQRTRITPSIVAGSALIAGRNTVMTAGMSYTWYDQPQAGGVTYWLEDVDLDGTQTLHGPIAPALSSDWPNAASTNDQTANQGRQNRSELLSEAQKHAPGSGSYFGEWPAVFASQHAELVKAPQSNDRKGRPDAAQVQSQAAQEQIGGTAGIKISVSRSGWQRITQPELVAAGLDPNVSAQKLQLYANGSPVPIRLSGNGIGLTASDYLEFYGHGLESPTDLDQTYYLVVGKGTGSRIGDVKKAQTLPPPSGPSSFDYTVERKDKYIYYAALLNGDKENIFGHIVFSSPVDETVPVSNRDPVAAAGGAQAGLDVSLVGVSLGSHHVRVSVNGTDVGTIDFQAGENPSRTFAVPSALLVDGDNTVRFVAANTEPDVSLVETVRLTYPHSFKADNNSLAIGVNSAGTTRVSGFTTSSIRVVDITNQSNMSELTQTISVKPQADGTFAADIQVPNATLSSPHTLLVFAGGQALHPDLVKRNDPSSWAKQTVGFDYLLITSRDFKTNVEPLAQLRRNQGLTVGVVDVEDLYDEFSFGVHSPQAVHDFLQAAVNNWSRKPSYVLLAGDASYDPKNYLGQGWTDFVPTRLFDTALMETASDDWLADLDGDGIADVAIGRLPLRTAGDADLMVNKIISYENMAPDPQRNVILVADYSFEGSSDQVRNLVPAAIPVQVINRSSSDDGTIHTQIINGINQGPRLVNYVGHGSIGVWTGAPVLSTDDAPLLTNNRLSVFVMMTCMNGYFQNPYDDSLSEALLRTQGGAVAVWASTGLTDPGGQDLIDQEFYRQLFGGAQPTLGYAVLNAKHATSDSDVRRTWILFGDPAMRLK